MEYIDRTITFFILLETHFTFFRNSNKLRFVTGFANPVDIFGSHAETISLTRYHGAGSDGRNRDAEGEVGFSDRCPAIFTGTIHLHGVTGNRATAIVRWWPPIDGRCTRGTTYVWNTCRWVRWTCEKKKKGKRKKERSFVVYEIKILNWIYRYVFVEYIWQILKKMLIISLTKIEIDKKIIVNKIYFVYIKHRRICIYI